MEKEFSIKEKILFLKNYYSYFEVYFIIIILFLMFWLLVFFRMKKVEFDYKYNEINKKIEKSFIVEKELKAKKAELLSSKRLNELAKNFSLDRPKEDQVIIIPQVY